MNSNKKVLLALAMCGSVGSAFGYSWTFTNVTTKTLVVQVKLQAWSGVYFNVVRPGRNADFSWGLGNPRAGHCLEFIKVAELDKTVMGNRYNEVINKNNIDDSSIQQLLLRHNLKELPINWLEDKTWGQFDEKAQKAAGKLTEATGGAVNVIASAAAAAAGAPGLDFSSFIKPIGKIVELTLKLMEKSSCTDRHFDIMEDKGALTLITKVK